MKPSVIELTSILDKPALMIWANNLGLKGIRLDQYRKGVMKEGTSLHKQVEGFMMHNIPFLNHEMEEKCVNFFAGKRVVEMEKNIETDYFVGRYDIKFQDGEDVNYICDFKMNHTKVYLENILQLIGYRMGDECDKIGVISLPDFTYFPIEIPDFTPYEQIMINLSNIYNLKNQINGKSGL
jgi:hypothetical protein